MKAVLSRFCAVALAISTAVAVTPAMAAPGGSLRDMAHSSDARLILVDGGPEVTGQTNSGRAAVYRGGGYRGHHYRGHRSYGRHYRGHRGGHYYRRHNNGAGIAAGLITGAIVGGVIANSGRGYSGGSAHTRWCYDRYRSYRASDNTFQPYNGPRRQCVSPY